MFVKNCARYSQRALQCTAVLYRQHRIDSQNLFVNKMPCHGTENYDYNEQKTLTTSPADKTLRKQLGTRLQRASLLTQLAKKETTDGIKECETVQENRTTNSVERNNDKNGNDNSFLKPYHFAPQFRSCANQKWLYELSSLAPSSLSEEQEPSLSTPSAVEELDNIENSLRQSTNYASTHNTIALRKDSKLYDQACREFYKTHHRWPNAKEVSPNVNVSVSSVSVLKALEHCDPNINNDIWTNNNNNKNNNNSEGNKTRRCANSIYKAARESIKLQQAITRNQLAQSNDRVLMRCEKCFHVYAARPRTLYRDELNHSWAVLEHEVAMQKKVKELTIKPQRRKAVYSVARQQRQFKDSPTCCPHCKSTTHQQWMFEYVHQRTHCHLLPSPHEKKRLRKSN